MRGQTTIYKVGRWVIYPDALLLQKGGLDYKVQDKIMQVLIVLLEANGEIVSKDEFYEKVWANTIVTENSLSKAISELRKILDDPTDTNFIETVPKRGYRVIPNAHKERVPKKGIAQSTRSKKIGIFIASLVIILGASIFYLIGRKEFKKASTLAPNGEAIAYYEKKNGHYILQVENIEEKEIKEIANNLNPESFVINWSTNGEFLVYNATRKLDPFYSINISSLKNDFTTYIKFAKNEKNHQTESTPEKLDSLIYFVDHKEIKRGEDKIHHIYMNEKDTIKVFFRDNLIRSFSW